MSTSESRKTKSVYERVIVAAREAKRLNQKHRESNITLREKVTNSAIRRVEEGDVAFDYVDGEPPADDEEDAAEWKH